MSEGARSPRNSDRLRWRHDEITPGGALARLRVSRFRFSLGAGCSATGLDVVVVSRVALEIDAGGGWTWMSDGSMH